jgi:hypothetical protein
MDTIHQMRGTPKRASHDWVSGVLFLLIILSLALPLVGVSCDGTSGTRPLSSFQDFPCFLAEVRRLPKSGAKATQV